MRRIGPRQNCLPTIDLTIGTLQQQANENRRAEVVCSSDFSAFSRETIQEDSACLTAEEARMIELVNDERCKPRTFSAEDALKDIDLFSRILRSSYGAYYLYEKADWDAAADSWYVTAINGSDRRSENKAQLINLRELRLQFLKGINREASRRNGQFAALLDFNGQIVLKSFCCIIYSSIRRYPNMAEEKKVVTLDDFEQRLMVSSLMDFRNDLLRDEKPTEDINDLILKAIDAPTKKEKRRADREAR